MTKELCNHINEKHATVRFFI